MLKERVVTALVLLALLAFALFFLPLQAWWVFCGVVALASGWEWAGLPKLPSALRWTFALVVAITVISLCFLGNRNVDAVLFALSGLFWIGCVPAWLRERWSLGQGARALLVGLLVLVPAAVALARLRELSPWLLLGVAAIAWVADIAAYFGGRAFGRRKLAPSISPGKSWEGVWSGAVGVLVYGGLVYSFVLPQVPGRLGWPIALILLIVLTMVSVLGDLFESLLKRQAGVKDSSALLPGHGGVLDRIDSLTSTLPLAALWILVWTL